MKHRTLFAAILITMIFVVCSTHSAQARIRTPRDDHRFCKIGDSNTAFFRFLTQVDTPNLNLGGQLHVMHVVDHFRYSFGRESWAAINGIRTTGLTDIQVNGWQGIHCVGQSWTECEIAKWNCQYAMIMVGTNDVAAGRTAIQYQADLYVLLDQVIMNGVTPILSTLPARCDIPGCYTEIVNYNTVIREIANLNGWMLVDLYAVLATMPNQGLHPDRVHLSLPPTGLAGTATFDSAHLAAYGSNMRNWVTLLALQQALNQANPTH